MSCLDQEVLRSSISSEWPNVPPGGFIEIHHTIEHDMTNITMSPSEWFQVQVVDENLAKFENVVCIKKISTFEHELTINMLEQDCLEHKDVDTHLLQQLHQEKQLIVRVSLFQSSKLGEFLIEFQKRRGDSCMFGQYYRQNFAKLSDKLSKMENRGLERLERPKSLELGEFGNFSLCF